MLNSMRDKNEGMFIPVERREDTCDHGLSIGLRLKTKCDG